MNGRLKKILISSIILLVLLAIVEGALRFMGFVPGAFVRDKNLAMLPFDRLKESHKLSIADVREDGLLRFYAPTNARDTAGLPPEKRAEVMATVPIINEFGFNSWDIRDTSKKEKIMLLGDSFTWGFDADPTDSSFAGLMKHKNPNKGVFNMGLAGIDLSSYLYIAEKWIPIIKPNVCVVNFYMNDYIMYEKKPMPFLNQDIYMASSGYYMATNPDSYETDSIEVFKDFEQARKYMTQKFYLEPHNGFEKLLSKTVIGTLLAKFFVKRDKVEVIKFKKNLNSNELYLERLEKLCKDNNVKLVLSYIPDVQYPNDVARGTAELKNGFPKSYTKFNIPKNLTKADYREYPKWHLNNVGHYKYYQHISSLIGEAVN